MEESQGSLEETEKVFKEKKVLEKFPQELLKKFEMEYLGESHKEFPEKFEENILDKIHNYFRNSNSRCNFSRNLP